MTRSTTTKHDRAAEQRTRPAIPAPRRSPEERPAERPAGTREPDVPADYPLYPLIRYALDHATALHPTRE